MTQTETLVLPDAMRDEIIAHSRDHAPRECCGVIAGRDGQLTRLFRLTNVEQGVDRYLFDEDQFFQVYWQQIENAGDELMVVYHSHPVSVAYPSKTDVKHLEWPEAVYIICSLEDPESPVLRAFRIVDEVITEVAISR